MTDRKPNLANRETLKGYFKAGTRPSESAFKALIDAALIMNDEGFHKKPEDGLVVTSAPGSDALLTFSRRQADGSSGWRLQFLGQDHIARLRLGQVGQPDADLLSDADQTAAAPRPALLLGGDLEVGDGLSPASGRLLVNGTIQSHARSGTPWQDPVPADGQWHPITGELHGCTAFEVVAGIGLAGSGRFALLHAIALNAYNPSRWDDLFGRRKPIRSVQALYGRWSDRLQLRWRGIGKEPKDRHGLHASYQLEIRTRSRYEHELVDPLGRARDEVLLISTRVSSLWDDAHMGGSLPPDPGAGAGGPMRDGR
ncbi:MAG: hypothetical protein RL490_1977 [Pseudomonadota bacterium]|jgi:hypothetical protein